MRILTDQAARPLSWYETWYYPRII